MNKHFWATDFTAAADYCRRSLPSCTALSLSLAGEILNNRFTFRDHWEMERTHEPVDFGDAIDWSYIPDGDPEWLYAMNRHTSFVNLGKAYRYTGEERFANKFAELITHWIDHVPLTDGSSQTMWRSLEAGLRCEYWLRSLRMFEHSPALTPALRARIDSCLEVHADYLLRASGEFQRLSNWGVLQDRGLFLLGLYLDRPDCVETAIRRLDEQLSLQVMDDGSHWEQSPMYHCEVLRCAIDVVTIARQNNLPLPESYTNRVHNMCTALAKWLTPDGRLVCQSDSDDTDARDVVAQGALLFADGYLRCIAGETLFEENIWDFGVEAVARYAALVPVLPALASSVLPDSGNYMLRSRLDTDGVFLHMHCGSLGSGHGHADLLHVDLSAYGEDILIDSGRYTYVNSPLRRELKLPKAHNTTRVDDADFSECVDSWGYSQLANPLKGECKLTETADYISGSHMGYLSLAGGSVLVTRQVVYLKPNLFVIVDSFAAQGTHQYEQNFHLGGSGESRLEGNILRWQGKRAAMTLCATQNGNCVMGHAPFSKDYNSLCQGDLLTVTQTGTGLTNLVTVAAVRQGTPPQLTVQRIPVTTARLGKEIPPELAYAMRIALEGQQYLVLFCHGEVISEVDTLSADGRGGYGKVIIFTPDHPAARTLCW